MSNYIKDNHLSGHQNEEAYQLRCLSETPSPQDYSEVLWQTYLVRLNKTYQSLPHTLKGVVYTPLPENFCFS